MTPTPEEVLEQWRPERSLHGRTDLPEDWAEDGGGESIRSWCVLYDLLSASQEWVGDLEAIIDYLEGGPGENARAWVAMQERVRKLEQDMMEVLAYAKNFAPELPRTALNIINKIASAALRGPESPA